VDGAVQLSAAPAWPTECSPSAFTHWAVERHLDSLAARLGVEPIELKLGNLRPDADGEANIRRTLELSGYANKRALFRDENRARKSRGERKRLGIGASLLSEPLGLVCQVAQIEFDLDTYETTLHELWCGESLTNNDGKPWLFAAGRESSTLSAGIAAAIEYAAGLAIQDLPLSPERLLESQLAL
jgi:CO/xanthine dehydrogenase Mo-binding subunit